MTNKRVLVIGAGPVGLAVAAAIASKGIEVDLIDKRPTASPHSRAFGLEPATLELLNAWGVADEMIHRGIVWDNAPLGDKGGRSLSFSKLPSEYPYMVIIPQSQTESVLTNWALKVGVNLKRNHELQDITPYKKHVEVNIRDGSLDVNYQARYGWVLGADGINSTVRQQLNIPFLGQDYPQSLVVADVQLETPPTPAVYARSTSQGLVALFPLPNGDYRVSIEDNQRMNIPLNEPVTHKEISDGMRSILGDNFGLSQVQWSARYRSKQRLAESYRLNRVFLLGDAAHTHVPAGGQGLQMGLADAANLSWKLIGTIQGHLSPEVLDSYEQERKPIAADALRNTDLLFRFNTASGIIGRLIHWLGLQATRIPYVANKVVKTLAGNSLYYRHLTKPGDSQLVGRRLPLMKLFPSNELTEEKKLSQILTKGQFVFVHYAADKLAEELVEHYPSLDVIQVRDILTNKGLSKGEGALVRPDGIVIWSGHELLKAKNRLSEWIIS